MMALEPFTWGQGGAKLTATDVARNRKVAEALANRVRNPQNMWEGIQSAVGDIGGALLNWQSDRAESEGRQAVADALLQAQNGGDPNAYISILGNEFASPSQSAVAQALLQRQWGKEDRAAEAAQPNWQTFESGGDMYRYNENDPNSRPDLFFDAPDPLPDAPTVVEQYDPETGRPVKQQWTGTGWQPFGGVAAPKDPLVNVDMSGNSSEFIKEADKQAAGRMNDIVSAGSGAQSFMGDIQTLAEIGKTLNTGKPAQVLAVLGPFAEALGVNMEGLGEAQAYDAIVARMAPQMRVPGSGASSDFDARQFLKSLPSLGNTPEGNEIIIQTFSAIQEAKMAASDIASQALSGTISWQEADRQIRALGDPFTAFNKYRKGEKPGAEGAEETREVGGKKYVKRNGEWFEAD